MNVGRKRIWTLHFPRTHQIWWRYIHRWRRNAPKMEFETNLPGSRILLPVPISTRVFLLRDLQTGDITQCFIEKAYSLLLPQWVNCRLRKAKMAEPYFRMQIWWHILNRKPGFLFMLFSIHRSISLSFRSYSHVPHRRTIAGPTSWRAN